MNPKGWPFQPWGAPKPCGGDGPGPGTGNPG